MLLRYRRRRAGPDRANVQGAEGGQGAALDAAAFAPARSRRGDHGRPRRWSEFPLTDYGWSFFGLMNRHGPYLAGATDEQLNFEAGENVLLRLDPTARLIEFRDQRRRDQKPKPLPIAQRRIPRGGRAARSWGSGRSRRTADNRTATLGFSVNAPRSESRFAQLEKSDLDVIFGKDGYLLAEDADCAQGEGKAHALWLRGLSLAHVLDPDDRHPGELPGQHVLQGSPRRQDRPQRRVNVPTAPYLIWSSRAA